MSHLTATTTLGTIGSKTISVGFQPTWAEFRVCQKFNVADSVAHLSIGETDGTRQNVISIYHDVAGGISANSTSPTSKKVVSHYERVSGVIQEVLAADFNSFTATGIKLDVLIGNPNYQVIVTCGN